MNLIILSLFVMLTMSCNEAGLSGSEAGRSRTKRSSDGGADGNQFTNDQSDGSDRPNPNCNKTFELFFLIDTSTSMNCIGRSTDVESTSGNCVGAPGSKIDLAKRLAKDIRAKFKGSDASLVSYDIAANAFVNSDSDISTFNTRINDLEVYDGIRASTNLHAGLVKIQNDLQSSDKNSIVFVLSDGKSTIDAYKVPELVENLKGSSAVFHGIAVSGGGAIVKDELQALSGTVYDLGDESDISSISKAFSTDYCR